MKWWTTYVTVIKGKINPKFFGVNEGELPESIYTTANVSEF